MTLSGLDLLHLITSLAYLLLLVGGSGLRLASHAMRKRPPAPLPDGAVLWLGYLFPGLVGLLPLALTGRLIPLFGGELWSVITSTSLLWVPATQALALAILAPQTAAPLVEADTDRPPASVPLALLAGMGLFLLIAFIWQLAYTLPALALGTAPLAGMQLLLAILAACLMPFFSERFLRGRLLQVSINRHPSRQVAWLVHALVSAALTLRPAAFLPAAIAAYLFARLVSYEGRLRAATFAHLAFNLAAVFVQAQFIH
jgi:hypothetical protein